MTSIQLFYLYYLFSTNSGFFAESVFDESKRIQTYMPIGRSTSPVLGINIWASQPIIYSKLCVRYKYLLRLIRFWHSIRKAYTIAKLYLVLHQSPESRAVSIHIAVWNDQAFPNIASQQESHSEDGNLNFDPIQLPS